jgi:putative hemolysin
VIKAEKDNVKIGIESLLDKEQNKLLSLTAPVFNKVLSIDKLNDIYQQTRHVKETKKFVESFFEKINLTVKVKKEQIANIPKDGPVMIVANHPYGGIDGMMLMGILKDLRPDIKALANKFISQIDHFNQDCFFVDAFSKGSDQNRKPLMDSIKWLKKGGLLAVFPAGSVANFKPQYGSVSDDDWNPGIFRIAKMTGATVVTMHFSGRNSLLFNAMGAVHPAFRTALLPREFAKKGRKVTISIGKPIPPSSIKRWDDDDRGINYLRLQTLLLGEKVNKNKDFDYSNTDQEPIIQEIDREKLNKEIESLPADCHLLSYKDIEVYCATMKQMPQTMLEIGRLREITFRQAGEGSGFSCDIDKFDKHYYQLFMWNRVEKEVVGAYRMGLVDKLVDKGGIKKLYTSKFYRYTDNFIAKHKNAVELGRSFVRPEYQRKPFSLLLLWKGIGTWIMRNPSYRYLFGGVSVSSLYSPLSRAVIASSLVKDEYKLEPCDKRKSLKLSKEAYSLCRRLQVSNPEELSSLIKHLEADGKDIPPLIKHYMKMGGTFSSFSIDEEFGGTLDGLILVDLPNSPIKSLKNYLGDNYPEYTKRHLD